MQSAFHLRQVLVGNEKTEYHPLPLWKYMDSCLD